MKKDNKIKPNIRVVFVTCSLFLLAIIVSLAIPNVEPFILGVPFSLCFDIGISFLLCFYYLFEVNLMLRGTK